MFRNLTGERMADIVERLRAMAAAGFVNTEEAANEIERLRMDLDKAERDKCAWQHETDLWKAKCDEIERLREQLGKARSLLHECLTDYGHPNFTDRHGMADRLRLALTDK